MTLTASEPIRVRVARAALAEAGRPDLAAVTADDVINAIALAICVGRSDNWTDEDDRDNARCDAEAALDAIARLARTDRHHLATAIAVTADPALHGDARVIPLRRGGSR